MRILMITARADIGGGPRHVDGLIQNLPEKFELFLACPKDEPYFSEWEKNPKVKKLFQIPHRKFSFVSIIRLMSFIRDNRIDLVHSHGKGAGIYGRIAKILSRFWKIQFRVVHTFHGLHLRHYGKLMRWVYLSIERFLCRRTDTIINVSAGEQQQCLEFDLFRSDQSRVILNGVIPLKKINNARKDLQLPDGKCIMVSLSRFDYAKNMSQAFEIAKKMRDNPKAFFLWIGDGEERPVLEDRARTMNLTNIRFAGFQKNIDQWLSGSDVYLSTSRWEGLPLSLLEASSLGLVIVASNVVGNNEVVVEGENGFLYDPNDIDQAANRLTQLIDDKTLYEKMSENAQAIFEKKFHSSTMISKLADVYSSYDSN